MTKPPIKINVDKKQAVLIYVILISTAFYLLFTLLNSDNSQTGIFILKIVYILFAIPFCLYGISTLFNKRFIYGLHAIQDEAKEPIITISDEEIVCSFPSTMKKEKIRWQDIVKIQVLTTDEGPYLCDVFFVLLDSSDKGVVIPQDKQEESKIILDRIMKFPGFDSETFIQSMGSTEVKWFTVWEKKQPS